MLYYRDTEEARTDRVQTNDFLYLCSAGTNCIGPHAPIHADYTLLRPEGRMDYHILYMQEGCCHLTYRGEVHILQGGDFALYPPAEPQQYTLYCEGNNRYHWVHFKGSGAAAFLQALGLVGGVYRHGESEEALASFAQLSREFHLRRGQYVPYCASLLAVFLCCLSRTQERCGMPPAAQAQRREIYDIAAAISEAPGTVLSLDRYAEKMHLSRDRFVHLFRTVMGVPPHRYIQNARIAMARRLLRESDLTVGEIAGALGYRDALYFSRLFCRTVGVPPGRYRHTQ